MEPCFIKHSVMWSLPTLHPGLELILQSQKLCRNGTLKLRICSEKFPYSCW